MLFRSEASSSFLRGAIFLVESVLSLNIISSSIDSNLTDLSLICLWRLSALILGSARRKNLNVAFGKTTVPISLPSITI